MREILFRGKRKDNGKWAVGSFLKRTNQCIEQFEFADDGVPEPYIYEVIPESVSEFSGLCDKNGKKIFEGDVVKGMFRFGSPVKAVIKFQDGAFGLAWFRGSVQFDAFTSICNVEYEVIGNIHDNPELLKGGAE